jgi:hypothetical protein
MDNEDTAMPWILSLYNTHYAIYKQSKNKDIENQLYC